VCIKINNKTQSSDCQDLSIYCFFQPVVVTSSRDGKKAYLSACCFGSDDKFDMADLSVMSFSEAWNTPEFVKLREAHIAKDVTGTVCEKCLAYA